METIKKSRFLYTLAFVLILGLMCRCSDDRDHYGVSGGNEKMVTFSVKVPGSGTPRTYALDKDDENEVKSIAILLFDNAGKYTYQPVYCNKIDPDPSEPSNIQKKTFSVKIPEGTYSSLVILANANQVVGDTINSISQGEGKASVISKLVLTNGKWNATPGSSGYIDIPMWGEISNITIGSSTPANNPVNLVRMVSKIDVALTSPTAKSAFSLQSVRLYNYNDRGQVAPDADKWNAGDGKVTAPTVPSLAQKPSDPVNNPYVYDGAAITTDGAPTNARGISCTGEIYTFEAAAGSGTNLQSNTCLVIGGYYGSDSQLTYYRVDFANTAAGTTTYLSLLRNHHYKVNISDVSGPGLPNPEDAFSAPPVNIKASIVEWNDGRFTEFAVNDQYLLGVSQGVFNFDREERTALSTDNTLSVITDYSGGWKVSKIVGEDGQTASASWLTCSPASGSNSAGNDIKLLLKENTGTSGRTAFIHLTADADRLAYVVKVTQTAVQDVSIRILDAPGGNEITELVFPNDVITKEFYVQWSPSSSGVTVTHTSVGSYNFMFNTTGTTFLPDEGGQPSPLVPSGGQKVTVVSAYNSSLGDSSNLFDEAVSKIDFAVYSNGNYASRSLYLRQTKDYGLQVSGLKSAYMFGSAQYSFRVLSNANWRIKEISGANLLALQSSDNLRVGTTGGYNTSPGTEIRFHALSSSLSSDTVTVTFESTDNPKKFDDVPVTFSLMGEYYPASHSGWAGSNIYWDGSKLTFDDVGVTTSNRNYQGVYFKWGSLYGIAPNGALFDSSTTVYKPNESGYSVSTSASWTDMTAAGIPRKDDASVSSNPPSSKTERDRAYLYEITDETAGIGDICKYLTDKGWAPGVAQGKKWRMPTSNEFNSVVANESSLTSLTSSNNTDYTWSWTGTAEMANDNGNGTALFPRGVLKSQDGNPFFPASGYRGLSDGALGGVGSNGYYWSASPPSTTYGCNLSFNSTSVFPNSNNSRANGFSVRCVQE